MKSNDLKTLSKLAGISMSDAEMLSLEADILKIRAMADELSRLDLDSFEPRAVMTLDKLRCDTVKPFNAPSRLVECAPTKGGEYITVPAGAKEGL